LIDRSGETSWRAARRSRNEWAAANAASEGESRRAPFFCECDGRHCHTIVWLSLDEYGRLRGDPDLYLVAPGHQLALTTVIEGRTSRFFALRPCA
jgi:hypothetical protein